MASNKPQELTMVVDLDERGIFRAHVDDQAGKTVFAFQNEDESGWPDEAGIWLVDAGYMKHGRDADGLHEYMLQVGLAKHGSTLRIEG